MPNVNISLTDETHSKAKIQAIRKKKFLKDYLADIIERGVNKE